MKLLILVAHQNYHKPLMWILFLLLSCIVKSHLVDTKVTDSILDKKTIAKSNSFNVFE
ncbi:hypothetical protein GCM10022271_16790 [Corallibacter vietnamensis]|uniref:Lipoprotein n=1 Tax=Corallibacter vietnamensis TaxID=904130 RepID=A0ABP7H561_9FLAO